MTDETEKWEEVKQSPAWDPKKNPELIGVYEGTRTGVGAYKSNLHDFRNNDGEIVSAWGNTALDSKLKDFQVGDKVKVLYKGKLASKNRPGKFFHSYQIFRVLKE